MKLALLLFIDIVLLVLISLIHYKPQWFFTLKSSTTTTTPIPDTTTTTTTTVKPEDGFEATPAPSSYSDWLGPLIGLGGGLFLALVFFIVGYVDEKRKKRIRANRTPEQKDDKEVLEKLEIPRKILNSDYEESWGVVNLKLDLMSKESNDFSNKRAKRFRTALIQIEKFWKENHTKSGFLSLDKEKLTEKLDKIVDQHKLSKFKGGVWKGIYARIEKLKKQVKNTKEGDPI